MTTAGLGDLETDMGRLALLATNEAARKGMRLALIEARRCGFNTVTFAGITCTSTDQRGKTNEQRQHEHSEESPAPRRRRKSTARRQKDSEAFTEKRMRRKLLEVMPIIGKTMRALKTESDPRTETLATTPTPPPTTMEIEEGAGGPLATRTEPHATPPAQTAQRGQKRDERPSPSKEKGEGGMQEYKASSETLTRIYDIARTAVEAPPPEPRHEEWQAAAVDAGKRKIISIIRAEVRQQGIQAQPSSIWLVASELLSKLDDEAEAATRLEHEGYLCPPRVY